MMTLLPWGHWLLCLTWLPRIASQVRPLILSGTPASEGEFPWFVHSFAGTNLCGGSLVAADVVLSAAHCNDAWSTATKAVVGSIDYRGRDQRYNITSEIIIHPNFNGLVSDGYDYLMFRIQEPLDYTIVDLNTDIDYPTTTGQPLQVMGYGYTVNGGPVSEILLKAQVPFVDFATCDTLYQGQLIEPTQICAGGQSNIGACQGDSGGPLIDSSGRQVGLVSRVYNATCGTEFPVVFSSVAAELPWIYEQICSLSQRPPSCCATNTCVSGPPVAVPTPFPTRSPRTPAPVTSRPTPRPSDVVLPATSPPSSSPVTVPPLTNAPTPNPSPLPTPPPATAQPTTLPPSPIPVILPQTSPPTTVLPVPVPTTLPPTDVALPQTSPPTTAVPVSVALTPPPTPVLVVPGSSMPTTMAPVTAPPTLLPLSGTTPSPTLLCPEQSAMLASCTTADTSCRACVSAAIPSGSEFTCNLLQSNVCEALYADCDCGDCVAAMESYLQCVFKGVGCDLQCGLSRPPAAPPVVVDTTPTTAPVRAPTVSETARADLPTATSAVSRTTLACCWLLLLMGILL